MARPLDRRARRRVVSPAPPRADAPRSGAPRALLRHRSRLLRAVLQRRQGRRPRARPGQHLLPQRSALPARLPSPLRDLRPDQVAASGRQRAGRDARPRLVLGRIGRAAVPHPSRAVRRSPLPAAAAQRRAGRRQPRIGGQRPEVADRAGPHRLQRLQPRRDLRRPPRAARLGRRPPRRPRLGRRQRSAGSRRAAGRAAPAPHQGDGDPRPAAHPRTPPRRVRFRPGPELLRLVKIARTRPARYGDRPGARGARVRRRQPGRAQQPSPCGGHARRRHARGAADRPLHPARRPGRRGMGAALHPARVALRGGHRLPRHPRARRHRRTGGAHQRARHRPLHLLERAAQPDPRDVLVDLRQQHAGPSTGFRRPLGTRGLAGRPDPGGLPLQLRLRLLLGQVGGRHRRLPEGERPRAQDQSRALAPHARRLRLSGAVLVEHLRGSGVDTLLVPG